MPTLTAGQSKTQVMAPGWVVTVSAPANANGSVTDTPYEVGQTIDTQTNQPRRTLVGPVSFSKVFGPWDAGATVVIANAANSGADLTYTFAAVAKGPMRMLWSEQPDPIANAGATMFFTDVGGGGGEFMAFGSPQNRWKVNNNDVLIDNIDTANVGVTGVTPQQLNPNHILIPAGLIGANGDRLFVRMFFTKSGTTDTASIALRFGTAGTVADTLIATVPVAAASRTAEIDLVFKRTGATTLQLQAISGVVNAINGESAVAAAGAVTVTNMNLNAMYMSLICTMGGTTDTPTMQDYSLKLSHTDAN